MENDSALAHRNAFVPILSVVRRVTSPIPPEKTTSGRLIMQTGVFGNSDSWYVRELCRAGGELGHAMIPLRFETMVARIRSNTIEFVCFDPETETRTSLNSLDTVIVRTMPPGSLEQVVARMDMLAGLQALGVRIVNSPRALECAVDKFLTSQKLALAGIPTPATIACESEEAAMDAFEQLGRDVVVKPLFGAEGRGLLRVTERELAHRTFRTLSRLGAVLYVQQYVHSPGYDVRILLLDGEVVGSMKRFPAPGDFRTNVAQQGRGEPHTPTDQELQLARLAARHTQCLFAGVDLMHSPDGEPLIIEVNAVPGWRGLQTVCQIDVARHFLTWLHSSCPLH
ncbi:MAG: RimK family alpha-L-glutamate ligase [Planctomycetaceae bacterium]|nr:RimK family alpha-L-glutamate ligase [Planctomycetaceae bacterium]